MRIYENCVGFYTVIYREISRFSRLWIQTIIPPAVTTILYFIIFGQLIGRFVQPISGIPYLEYIVPGLIMMAIITNAYANVVSSFFSAKFQRHIEELLVSPLPNSLILLGYMSGGIARGIAVGIAVTIVSCFFAPFKIFSLTYMIIVVLLTACLFSLGGIINAIYAKKFDDINLIPTFILTPLTYLGGVFYSVQWLPEFWQTVSRFNPIFYMINAFRYSMFGVSDVDIHVALLIIIGFVVILFGFSLYLLNKGIGIRS
jgi:ABC-2 type transport system permease protein